MFLLTEEHSKVLFVKFWKWSKRYLSLILQIPEAIFLTAGNLMSSRFNPNLTPSYWGSHYWRSIACNHWINKRICGFKRPCLAFAFERWKFFLRCETFFKKHPCCKIWLRGFHLLKSKINKKLLNITDKANRFWPPTEFVKPALSVMSFVTICGIWHNFFVSRKHS